MIRHPPRVFHTRVRRKSPLSLLFLLSRDMNNARGYFGAAPFLTRPSHLVHFSFIIYSTLPWRRDCTMPPGPRRRNSPFDVRKSVPGTNRRKYRSGRMQVGTSTVGSVRGNRTVGPHAAVPQPLERHAAGARVLCAVATETHRRVSPPLAHTRRTVRFAVPWRDLNVPEGTLHRNVPRPPCPSAILRHRWFSALFIPLHPNRQSAMGSRPFATPSPPTTVRT